MLSIKRVIKRRQKIIDHVDEYIGVTLVGHHFEGFVTSLHETLPHTLYKSIYESVRNLAGQELDEKTLKDTAWRLAGNIETLQQGSYVPTWSVQLQEEWVPLQITNVEMTKYRGEVKARVTFKVLAGSPCPMDIVQTWSYNVCSVVATQHLGFSPSFGDFPYRHFKDLVSMQFHGEITPERCTDGKPGFHAMKGTSATIANNRAIMKMRQRLNFVCMEGYEPTVECRLCWRGYESCPAACRPRDLVAKHCPTCKEESWFEPTDGSSCISCTVKRKSNEDSTGRPTTKQKAKE